MTIQTNSEQFHNFIVTTGGALLLITAVVRLLLPEFRAIIEHLVSIIAALEKLAALMLQGSSRLAILFWVNYRQVTAAARGARQPTILSAHPPLPKPRSKVLAGGSAEITAKAKISGRLPPSDSDGA